MTIARTQTWAAIVLVLAALLAAGTSSALADSHDERFLAGLRQRRLYELAERYCVDRLAEADLAAARRATLTIELSRSYAEQAVHADPKARAKLWQQSQQTVEEFVARNPRDPRVLLVRVQGALAALAQGQLAREDAELADTAQPQQARSILRGAIAELRSVDQAIAAELQEPGRRTRRPRDDELAGAELSSLQLHVRYQLARALRNQGLCYPTASPDRINALGQAIELLAALGQYELTPELSWDVRADAIACLRLAGNFNQAERKLSQAERASPPDAMMPKLRAERIRLALARSRVDEALAEAGAGAVKHQAGWAEANLARLEAYLAGWRRAQEQDDTAGAQRWERAAIDQVRAIGQAHGPATSRRAETLLARSMVHSGGTENPRALLLAAQGLYRGGHLDEALAAFDEAANRAAAKADKNTYFDSQYAAGALEYERQHHRAALDRLGHLAARMPQHPRAAEAHLLAIHSAAQVARHGDPPQLDEYQRLLRSHLDTWPTGPTASQAWYWLGRLAEHQHSWQEAIRALKNVKPDDPQYTQSVAAVGRCYRAALGELRRRGNRNDLLAEDAVDYFQRVIAPRKGESAAHTDATRAAVLGAVTIYLEELPGDADKAQHLLSSALRDDADAPRKWNQQARALMVPVLAAGGQVAKAENLLRQIPIGTASDALAMVELLSAVKDRTASANKPAVARLELAVIGDVLVKRDELDAPTIKNLVRRRADTLLQLGQRDTALAALRELAKKYPRDGGVQEDVARLLSSGADAQSWRAAVAKWRDVAGHCRVGSDRWFRAHVALAETQLDLGEPAKARATIKLVESSRPEMGGAEMKARFRQLLAECNRAPTARRSPNTNK